jgi:hypothetical protein
MFSFPNNKRTADGNIVREATDGSQNKKDKLESQPVINEPFIKEAYIVPDFTNRQSWSKLTVADLEITCANDNTILYVNAYTLLKYTQLNILLTKIWADEKPQDGLYKIEFSFASHSSVLKPLLYYVYDLKNIADGYVANLIQTPNVGMLEKDGKVTTVKVLDMYLTMIDQLNLADLKDHLFSLVGTLDSLCISAYPVFRKHSKLGLSQKFIRNGRCLEDSYWRHIVRLQKHGILISAGMYTNCTTSEDLIFYVTNIIVSENRRDPDPKRRASAINSLICMFGFSIKDIEDNFETIIKPKLLSAFSLSEVLKVAILMKLTVYPTLMEKILSLVE